MKTVSILGTQYTITKKKYSEDEAFKRRSIVGYCDDVLKEIVYYKMKTWEGYEHESKEYCKQVEKETLRHEIVHTCCFDNE